MMMELRIFFWRNLSQVCFQFPQLPLPRSRDLKAWRFLWNRYHKFLALTVVNSLSTRHVERCEGTLELQHSERTEAGWRPHGEAMAEPTKTLASAFSSVLGVDSEGYVWLRQVHLFAEIFLECLYSRHWGYGRERDKIS